MRVTSEFFVSALVRRVFSNGGFAAIERHGSPEAGAIFIRHRYRDGLEDLYGPAPQSLVSEEDGDDRRFEMRLERVPGEEVDALIARESRFDSDLWLVELETESIADLFALAAGEA